MELISLKVDLVIPTVRNVDFLKDWAYQLDSCHIIIAEDNKQKKVKIPKLGLDITHYCWNDMKKDLGGKHWIIPLHTAAMRSYGFLKSEADVVISLDDDCYPYSENFVQSHTNSLEDPSFLDTFLTYPTFPRGVPTSRKRAYRTVLNHGVWVQNPDFDAFTEMIFKEPTLQALLPIREQIPKGLPFSLCGMNFSFKKELKPAMFFQGFLPRYDDIFAGLFSKIICDHLNLGMKNGLPYVNHSKASNIYTNSHKEANGFILNERWFRDFDMLCDSIVGKNVRDAYLSLAEELKPYKDEPYCAQIKEAMKVWANLMP